MVHAMYNSLSWSMTTAQLHVAMSLFTHSEGQRTWHWMETVSDAPLSDCIETYSRPVLDPRELHIEHIFRPNRFHVLTILKALNVSIFAYCCIVYFN